MLRHHFAAWSPGSGAGQTGETSTACFLLSEHLWELRTPTPEPLGMGLLCLWSCLEEALGAHLCFPVPDPLCLAQGPRLQGAGA